MEDIGSDQNCDQESKIQDIWWEAELRRWEYRILAPGIWLVSASLRVALFHTRHLMCQCFVFPILYSLYYRVCLISASFTLAPFVLLHSMWRPINHYCLLLHTLYTIFYCSLLILFCTMRRTVENKCAFVVANTAYITLFFLGSFSGSWNCHIEVWHHTTFFVLRCSLFFQYTTGKFSLPGTH